MPPCFVPFSNGFSTVLWCCLHSLPNLFNLDLTAQVHSPRHVQTCSVCTMVCTHIRLASFSDLYDSSPLNMISNERYYGSYSHETSYFLGPLREFITRRDFPEFLTVTVHHSFRTELKTYVNILINYNDKRSHDKSGRMAIC